VANHAAARRISGQTAVGCPVFIKGVRNWGTSLASCPITLGESKSNSGPVTRLTVEGLDSGELIMGTGHGYDRPHFVRRLVVIAVAIIALAVVSLSYLIPRNTSRGVAAQSSPSPRSVVTSANISCPPTELKLTGVFNECAAIDKGQSCPAGSFDQVRVILLKGTTHQFLLYIEVNGIFHGAGTYPLSPWPHATLGVADGVAKVAIREYITGRLWESSAGSLIIEPLAEAGWVYAGLGASADSPVDVALNIAGWWSCS
jgi:hypothetical protein